MRRGKTELSVRSFKGTSERRAGRLPPARCSVSLESPDSEPSQPAKSCSVDMRTHTLTYTPTRTRPNPHTHTYASARTHRCMRHWWLLSFAVCQYNVLIHKTDQGLIPASCLSSAPWSPSTKKDRSTWVETLSSEVRYLPNFLLPPSSTWIRSSSARQGGSERKQKQRNHVTRRK